MTDTDIEAVARAMIDADCAHADRILEMMGPSYATINPTWETDSELYKTRARAAYRAVLEQLREPGEAAVIAVNEFERETLGGVTAGPRLHYSAAWEAMIDAKLAELEEKK
jgi:hypothetical protein